MSWEKSPAKKSFPPKREVKKGVKNGVQYCGEKPKSKTKIAGHWLNYNVSDFESSSFYAMRRHYQDLVSMFENIEAGVPCGHSIYDHNERYNVDLTDLCSSDTTDKTELQEYLNDSEQRRMLARSKNRKIKDQMTFSEIAFNMEKRINEELMGDRNKCTRRGNTYFKLPSIFKAKTAWKRSNEDGADGKSAFKLPSIFRKWSFMGRSEKV